MSEAAANLPAEISFPDNALAQHLFGVHNRHLKILEDQLGVHIRSFGNDLKLDGADAEVQVAGRVLRELYRLIEQGHTIAEHDVLGAAGHYIHHETGSYEDYYKTQSSLSVGSRRVVPKTAAQKHYIAAIRASTITFGVGPAGTGKTYLAVAAALESLGRKEVRRIVVSRPVVEAGERLGFLPGDLLQKIDPYLRPIYDAFTELLGDAERMRDLMARGIIEVAPLAYMRGRTLNQTFVILDEAQNTTRMQMKMFLTRLGMNSKMVVNGDITQVDLPRKTDSGLSHAERLLGNIKGIHIQRFKGRDVIRHRLVTEIIAAYEGDEES